MFTPCRLFQTMLYDCLAAVHEVLICPAQGDLPGDVGQLPQGHYVAQPIVTSTSSADVREEGLSFNIYIVRNQDLLNYYRIMA